MKMQLSAKQDLEYYIHKIKITKGSQFHHFFDSYLKYINFISNLKHNQRINDTPRSVLLNCVNGCYRNINVNKNSDDYKDFFEQNEKIDTVFDREALTRAILDTKFELGYYFARTRGFADQKWYAKGFRKFYVQARWEHRKIKRLKKPINDKNGSDLLEYYAKGGK